MKFVQIVLTHKAVILNFRLLMLVISFTFSELIVFLELCFLGSVRAVIKQETFQWLDCMRNASFAETDKFLINCLTKTYRQ